MGDQVTTDQQPPSDEPAAGAGNWRELGYGHAEFARFVQEAREQRDRATALEIALQELADACIEIVDDIHVGLLQRCRLCGHDVSLDGEHTPDCILATDQAARGAELLAAAQEMADAIESGLGYAPMKAAADRWRALADEGE